jgi:hypothetical protein
VDFVCVVANYIRRLQYWTEESERNGHNWQSEILGFRYQLEDRLTTNLRNYLAEEINNIYNRTLKYVQVKTKSQVNFLQENPYSLEKVLDINYLPN